MKVAQVISRKSCDSGGSLQALILSKSLEEEGLEVLFVSKGFRCEERAREFGLKHFSVPMKGYLDVKSSFLLSQLFERNKIKIAHAHKGLALWMCILSKFLFSSRVKIVANRGVSFSLSFWNRWKYKLPIVSGIVCVAYYIKHQLAKSWVNPEKLRVIYGSVDKRFLSFKDYSKARDIIKIPSSCFVVSLIGNFRPWKGHETLAKALASSRISSFLVLAGKEDKRLMEKVKSILGNRVLSLGYRRDVEYVMAASDIVVNASLEGEGLPGVLREAMILRRPVIATQVAGNREIVCHGKTGILSEKDSDSLKNFIEFLFSHPVFRRKLAVNSYRFSLRFTPEKRAKKMVKFYEKL